LHDIQRKLREGNGLTGDYQWLRLFEIVTFCKIFEPASVFEFGSGASTFAYHCGYSAASVVSVDSSDYWQKKAKKLDGEEKILWKLGPCVVADDGSEVTVNYEMTYSNANFVYVDGPTNHARYFPEGSKEKVLLSNLSRVRDRTGHAPDVDVAIMWKTGLLPDVVAVDGRRSTVRYLLEHNTAGYRCILKSDIARYKSFLSNPFFTYHTWFARNRKIENQLVRALKAMYR
jgi:hypothetical protein